MNYKFGLPVEIIFKCGAVKNINSKNDWYYILNNISHFYS